MIRDAYERGITLLRHRRGLWPLRERGTRRRGPGAGAQPRRHRHQVRLQDRRHERPGQPPRAHPPRGRGVAQAPEDRPHRPVLPAPRRSDRADRGRGRHHQGSDPAGQGAALRPVGAQRAHHSPRTRGAARGRDPDRILDHGAQRGAQRRAASVRGTGHRLRAVGAAGSRLPARQAAAGCAGRVRWRRRTCARPSPASAARS